MFKKYQQGGNVPYQSPLDMLAGNYGLNLEQLLGMSGQERATYFGERYGISDKSLLRPELFSSINQDLLRSMETKTYDPMISGQQGSLVSNLISQSQGLGTTGFGGASYNNPLSSLYDVYGKEMGNVLGNVSTQAQTAQRQVADIISGYGKTASELRV
jgi:hypothetical protein